MDQLEAGALNEEKRGSRTAAARTNFFVAGILLVLAAGQLALFGSLRHPQAAAI